MPFDRALIDRYAAGATALTEAVRGLTHEDLHGHPVPGTWSIQQLIIHLMDSDLIASDRMKRIAAMNNPPITAYDENAFANNLPVAALDVGLAADIFRLNRLITASMLRALPDAAYDRTGVHSERGVITLAGLVRTYTDHLDHHMVFLRDKLRALGKG